MHQFESPCFSPMEEELRRKELLKRELKELDEFKQTITSLVENYIKCIDTKISMQDLKIRNLEEKINLSEVQNEP